MGVTFFRSRTPQSLQSFANLPPSMSGFAPVETKKSKMSSSLNLQEPVGVELAPTDRLAGSQWNDYLLHGSHWTLNPQIHPLKCKSRTR